MMINLIICSNSVGGVVSISDATKTNSFILVVSGELIIVAVTLHQRTVQHMINIDIITNLKIKTQCRWLL